jgi:hypothetical protein
MALNEMHWDGQGYRSLDAVAFAAERAATAGGFKPLRSEFVMEWPEQERRYDWYDAEAVDAARRYGIPARAMMIVSGDDPLRGEVRILAIRHSDEDPIIRLSARGAAELSVRSAFGAAQETLSDPTLAMVSERDILEIKVCEGLITTHDRGGLPGIQQQAKLLLEVVEAHPTLVALIGVIVTVAIAILSR